MILSQCVPICGREIDVAKLWTNMTKPPIQVCIGNKQVGEPHLNWAMSAVQIHENWCLFLFFNRKDLNIQHNSFSCSLFLFHFRLIWLLNISSILYIFQNNIFPFISLAHIACNLLNNDSWHKVLFFFDTQLVVISAHFNWYSFDFSICISQN